LEIAMKRTTIAVTAFVATACLAPAAEAGFRIGFGFGLPMRHGGGLPGSGLHDEGVHNGRYYCCGMRKWRHTYVPRQVDSDEEGAPAPKRVKRPVQVKKEPEKKIVKAAPANPDTSSAKPDAEKMATTETQQTAAGRPSTKTVAGTTEAAPDKITENPPAAVLSSANPECKKFLPNLGLTVSVPCTE
jgi:hypothetical protein